MEQKKTRETRVLNLLMPLFLLLMLLPFYLILTNSLKNLMEITQSVFTLPPEWRFSNFAYAFEKMNFLTSARNTVVVELVANAGLILFGTMSGYWLIRRPCGINRVFYFLLLGAMAIPFQAIMIPMVKVMTTVGLHGSLPGLGVAYWGMAGSTVIFLTYGAIKPIPYEIEEAAIIDGCSQLGLFFRVIFPLLRTIVLTFTILNVFWVWNDYLMPQLMVGNQKNLYTIQMALKVFSGEHVVRWDHLLPAAILAMVIPVVIFIFCQRRIIDGMVSGAVKG